MNTLAAVTVFGLAWTVPWALGGCSSDSSSAPQHTGTQNRLNACATKDSTYLIHFVEKSGNCGGMPDTVLNTDPAGIAKVESSLCASVTQDGCTERATDCFLDLGNGCTELETYSTTFMQDGSSASSLLTVRIECQDGSGCYSTYEGTMTRK